MVDELERAFRNCENRGHTAGAAALLDRVESRLNEEIPSPLVARSHKSWWTAIPGPAVAGAAAAAVLLMVIGSMWLLGGFRGAEIAPIEEPSQPATTTIAVVTTTSPPSITTPAQALETPGVEPGEIRIGTTVITKRTLTIEGGRAVLTYDLTSLAPTGTAWGNEDGSPPMPAVLPESWEITTTNGPVYGTSVPNGHSVRFEIGELATLDDITAVRLIGWRTIVPVTYDFTVPVAARGAVSMPDGSTIGVSSVVETNDSVLVTFDVTLPADHWGAVPCGDGMVGESCFEPVPGSGWIFRQSDSDLQIGADPGTPLNDVPLRYRRPMWIRSEGSVELPLETPDTSGSNPGDFPDGYVPLTDTEAVKPTSIARYGDMLLVAMTATTRRGIDPSSFDPFMGGRWTLETTSGETLDSIGMAFNDHVGGAFTVIFPDPGESGAPVALRLVEDWRPDSQSGVVDTGPAREVVVGSLDGAPVDVELGGGSVVRIERFDIEGVGGYGTWYVPGDDAVPVIADVIVAFVDGDGATPVSTESWAMPPRNFGIANTGRMFWFWVTSDLVDDDGLAVLPDGELRFEVRVDAEVPNPVPADLSLDLVGVPVE